MESANTQYLNNRIQYWSILGPLFAVAVLAILLMKAPIDSHFLSLAILLGMPLCWFLKIRGLAIGLAILTLLGVYHDFIYERDQLWHFGILASIGLTFTITALSSIEINDSSLLFHALETVSEPQNLDQINLLKIEFSDYQLKSQEKIKNLEIALSVSETGNQAQQISLNELSNSQKSNLQIIQTLENTLAEREQIIQNQFKTLESLKLAQNENTQKEAVIKSLEQKHMAEVVRYEESLSEKESLIKDRLRIIEAVRAESDKKNIQHEKELSVLLEKLYGMQEKIKEVELSKNTLEKQLQEEIFNITKSYKKLELDNFELNLDQHKALEEVQKAQQICLQYSQKLVTEQENNVISCLAIEKLKQEHISLFDEIKDYKGQIETLSREKALLATSISNLQESQTTITNEQESEIKELRNELEIVTTERNQINLNLSDIERAWRVSEGRHQQLKSQFANKSATLDETRRQLFLTEEKLLQFNYSQNENLFDRTSDDLALEKFAINLENALETQQQQHEKEIDSLYALVAVLK